MIEGVDLDPRVIVSYRTVNVKTLFEEFVRNRPLETRYSDVVDFRDTYPNYSEDLLVTMAGD